MSFLGMERDSSGCEQSHVHEALALAVQLLRLQQTQHFVVAGHNSLGQVMQHDCAIFSMNPRQCHPRWVFLLATISVQLHK